jgi:2-polyprenyl-3-methyl-5-hydroxy-6-metoxy-1,4-benzoquinol methylase
MKTPSPVQAHFDAIAPRYDSFKKRNWYYYSTLKELMRQTVGRAGDVLEVGCGTGEVLVALEVQRGIGIDISEAMIARAKEKFARVDRLTFVAGTLETLDMHHGDYDCILLVDVIEHLECLSNIVSHLQKISRPSTRVIVSMANPRWEPLLMLLERLGLKMPEGPHRRISSKQLIAEFRRFRFDLKSKRRYLHLPAYVPFLSSFVNRMLSLIPFIKQGGLIEVLVFQRIAENRATPLH